MAYAVQTQAHSATLLARAADVLTDLAQRIERRRAYKKTVSELFALSNRELADLGMSRSMIRSVALEAAGY